MSSWVFFKVISYLVMGRMEFQFFKSGQS